MIGLSYGLAKGASQSSGSPNVAVRPTKDEPYTMGEVVSLDKIRKRRQRLADAASNPTGNPGDKPSVAKLNRPSSRKGEAFDGERLGGDQPKPGPRGA